ncbi:CpaF family protein [Candidatus Micrarchaeota archaeon]|nr:CpaF family protein [Candidatus Micrarchaeota archaeon]
MKLGWTLRESGAYRVPWNLGALTDRQRGVLDALLDAYALHPPRDTLRKTLEAALEALCFARRIRWDASWAQSVLYFAEQNLAGFGVLSHFLSDDDLEEIAVVGIGKPVYVFVRGQGWLETNAAVTSLDFAVDCVNKMARPLGRRLTASQPRLSAVLPDGSRLHACMAPVALEGIQISIRKFRKTPFSVGELVADGFLPSRAAAVLSLAMQADASVVVAGNTGSGKTTLLNALSEFVPASERIVAIEDAPELSWPHAHQVRLVGEPSVFSGLVADTLRMRPDRVVVGEMRRAQEVAAFFDVLLSGQAKGAYATFHAESAQDVVSRLEFLGLNPRDVSALDFVVVLKRFSDASAGREKRIFEEFAFLEQGAACPVLVGSSVNPLFFRSKAFRKISRSHGLNPVAFRKKMDAEAKKWIFKTP